jgi:hypothetical protein
MESDLGFRLTRRQEAKHGKTCKDSKKGHRRVILGRFASAVQHMRRRRSQALQPCIRLEKYMVRL